MSCAADMDAEGIYRLPRPHHLSPDAPRVPKHMHLYPRSGWPDADPGMQEPGSHGSSCGAVTMAGPSCSASVGGSSRSRCSRPSSRWPSTTPTPSATSTSTSLGVADRGRAGRARRRAWSCRSAGAAWSPPTASRSAAAHAVRVWCLSQTARYLPTGHRGLRRPGRHGREGGRAPHAHLAQRSRSSSVCSRHGPDSSPRCSSPRRSSRHRGGSCSAPASLVAIVALPALLALGGRLFPRAPALAPHLLDRRQMHEATLVYGVNAALKSARWLMIAAGVLTVHGVRHPVAHRRRGTRRARRAHRHHARGHRRARSGDRRRAARSVSASPMRSRSR